LSPELLLIAQICTKSFVGWGFTPDHAGELTVLPHTPSWFRGGPLGKGKEGREGGKGGRGREGR